MRKVNKNLYLECISEMNNAKYGNKPEHKLSNSQQLGFDRQKRQLAQRGFLSSLISAGESKSQELKNKADSLALVAHAKLEEAKSELAQAKQVQEKATNDVQATVKNALNSVV